MWRLIDFLECNGVLGTPPLERAHEALAALTVFWPTVRPYSNPSALALESFEVCQVNSPSYRRTLSGDTPNRTFQSDIEYGRFQRKNCTPAEHKFTGSVAGSPCEWTERMMKGGTMERMITERTEDCRRCHLTSVSPFTLRSRETTDGPWELQSLSDYTSSPAT
ncbi:hypothetical protein J6590_063875 [Homalodisca vitripennis]|nr:hypothetical protein J6590_063875 [Homalodisca vitripennis]